MVMSAIMGIAKLPVLDKEETSFVCPSCPLNEEKLDKEGRIFALPPCSLDGEEEQSIDGPVDGPVHEKEQSSDGPVLLDAARQAGTTGGSA